MSTPNETTSSEEMLQETTNDAAVIFTPEVIAFLEKAARAEQAYHTERAKKRTRPIDIWAAPDCDIDLLAEVPRVTIGPNGKPHLVMLPLEYEGEIGEEVEATAELPLSDLMLVRTKRGAFLMRQSDYETNIPKRTHDELHQQNMRDLAHDLINGMTPGISQSELDPTADVLWNGGARLMEAGGPNGRFERLGILMMLDALLMSPEAVQNAIQVLHDEYRDAHPLLPYRQ